MLNLYFDFGNEPIHCGRDAESGSHIAEAVYLWKHGQLTADLCDYWARGVSVESLPDIQMLLTTGPAFRGPHVDGEPQLPVVATLLSGRKLWVFLPENGEVKRFIIRRGWKLRELAEYLAVSLLLLDEIRKKLKKLMMPFGLQKQESLAKFRIALQEPGNTIVMRENVGHVVLTGVGVPSWPVGAGGAALLSSTVDLGGSAASLIRTRQTAWLLPTGETVLRSPGRPRREGSPQRSSGELNAGTKNND